MVPLVPFQMPEAEWYSSVGGLLPLGNLCPILDGEPHLDLLSERQALGISEN
uniref:Uncharacterized protein n=1 Tax=Arundo donax TaxID=35708 RepID=A0A0A8YCS2_ARUDO